MESVKIHHEPRLDNPCLVAAWPGVGNVALIAATYLKDKLKATEFGEIEPSGFFDIGGVYIKGNIIEEPQLPESKFYYWDSGGEGKDVMIFLSDAQPAYGTYEYAGIVLDVAERFGVKRIYTLAAALTEHHPDQPRVLGAASSPGLLEELNRLEVVRAGDFYTAGLNGLLLGVAKIRDMEGICLLGETVKYAARMANPRSSHAVLKVLNQLLGVDIDMAELEDYARNIESQLRQVGDEMRREFLQRYTKPIWQREEHEENS